MFKLVVLLSFVVLVQAKGFIRVCYYSNWAQYRPMPARMTPGQIDPNICTHLIYAFAKLDFKSELNFTEWNDGTMVKEFNRLKKENPYLKTLLAVGGYNQGSGPISDMAADRNLMKKFVRTSIDFLKKWDFDGLDIDWEFPAGQDGRERSDKRNFNKLLKEFRQQIDAGNTKLLLTAAVPAGRAEIDKGYDIPEMEKYLDFVNLMSYDIHGDWERTAEHNSPLYSRPSEKDANKRLNVDSAATYLVKKGIPKEKLIIGLPTYGRHYKLTKKSNNNIGAKIKRSGTKGPYTKEDGFLAYYEVCELFDKGEMKWETDQLVPYLIHKNHWIGYDDEDSFMFKLEYVKENGFGGASVWTLDLDDFDQLCPDTWRPFPLVGLMKEILGEYIPDDIQEDEDLGEGEGEEDNWEQPDQQADGNNLNRDYKRVCYYTNWAQYRPGPGKFKVEDIDPSLCTHLIYSFAKLDTNSELVTFEWNDPVLYEEFNALKNKNPNLKTLIATGGWNAGSDIYSKMVSDVTKREHFAETSVEFLRKWGFDGLDLDWEYPARRGGVPEDRQNFIELLKDLNKEFDKDVSTTNQPRLLLTAAVAAGKTNIDPAYDIPEMAKYLDFINLMSYDFHGSWDGYVGHNSPLYARQDEQAEVATLNTDWAAKYWEEKGTPPEKLIIGLALYGRNYKLSDRNKNEFGDDVSGPGTKGPYTGQEGFLAYYEVCQILKDGATRKWNDEHEVPYLIDGDQWIGYDDKESFLLKLEYIKRHGYGGAMVWALDLDDFNQQCSSEKYPLMNVIKRELSGTGNTPFSNNDQLDVPQNAPAQPQNDPVGTQSSPQTIRTTQGPPKTVPTTQRLSQTEAPSPALTPQELCSVKPTGYYAHPSNCAKFVICANRKAIVRSCGGGTYWNPSISNCDHIRNVDCQNKRELFHTESVLEKTLLETLLRKFKNKMNGLDKQGSSPKILGFKDSKLDSTNMDQLSADLTTDSSLDSAEEAHLDNPTEDLLDGDDDTDDEDSSEELDEMEDTDLDDDLDDDYII